MRKQKINIELLKIKLIILFIIFSLFICNFIKEDTNVKNENVIISKIRHKKNKSEIDTLWVSQNDTTVFRKEEVIIHRPCSNPEMEIRYELINPKVDSYYFIYNERKQLISEGKYTKEYRYKGATNKEADFYNAKSYYYESNGNLKAIHYMENGRNNKTDFFDSEKRLTKTTYFD